MEQSGSESDGKHVRQVPVGHVTAAQQRDGDMSAASCAALPQSLDPSIIHHIITSCRNTTD